MKKLLTFANLVGFVCLTVAVLPSCNPQKKLNRLLMKYPELHRTDTIRDTVTAIVEYVHTDTLWRITKDTLKLDNGRAHARTLILHDTLWQEVYCDADTVRVPVETVVDRVAPKEYVDRIPWWIWPIVGLLVALLALPRVTTAITMLKK